METGRFIAVGVGTVPPTEFSGHLLVCVSSGVTNSIYQACAHTHVYGGTYGCSCVCVPSFRFCARAAWGLEHRSWLHCVT